MIKKIKEFISDTSYITISIIVLIGVGLFVVCLEGMVSNVNNSSKVEVQNINMDVIEIEYDNHEYLLFKYDRGMSETRDSYSGVVHKENCRFCKY